MKIKRIISEYLTSILFKFYQIFFTGQCLKTRFEILLNNFILNFIYNCKDKSVYFTFFYNIFNTKKKCEGFPSP